MKRLPIYLSIGTLVLLGAAANADDVATRMKGCNGCHGDNGVSGWTDVPTIAGIDAFAHSEALYTYRDEARSCSDTEYRQGDKSRAPTNMCAIAGDLSDGQIEALAAAYAALPFVPAKQKFDANLAAKGKAIHGQHCDRCHSDGGTNPTDEASLLGGQWAGYLKTSLDEYAAGSRPQPDKMKEKIDMLSGEDIAALVQYYASLQ